MLKLSQQVHVTLFVKISMGDYLYYLEKMSISVLKNESVSKQYAISSSLNFYHQESITSVSTNDFPPKLTNQRHSHQFLVGKRLH